MTEASRQPVCWIIAGPNGAGKTTFALTTFGRFSACSKFINVDLIAAGLSPLDPEREQIAAGRIFLKSIDEAMREREDFAFETTLAGRAHLPRVTEMLASGWRVELIFLALPSIEFSRLRVTERVAHGGHDISAQIIERRFPRSLFNLFNHFAPRVSRARCYLNSGNQPVPVFEQSKEQVWVHDQVALEHLKKEAKP